MSDTIRGDFPKVRCSDCGVTGCAFEHWGPLVPPGEIGYFCGQCMMERKADYEAGNPPKYIGHKLTSIYTGAVFRSLKSLPEVIEEKNFLPPNEPLVMHIRGEEPWYINEAFVIRSLSGLYLIYHGYRPTLCKDFAVWIDGPLNVDKIDIIHSISIGGEPLFLEVERRMYVTVEEGIAWRGWKFRELKNGEEKARKFIGLIEGGALSGTLAEQVATAAKMLI